MSETIAQKVIGALRALEADRDVEPLVALYAEAASVGNVLRPDRFHGPDGARQFWTEYRGTFDQARSTFRNVIPSEGSAALEWSTEGTSLDGQPIRYDGVTILEVDGEKLTRSCAYFNPTALGEQIV